MTDQPWLGWVCAWGLASAAMTWLSLRYARRRGLVDAPGERRSHAVATPRGGGIAILAVLVLAASWSMVSWPHERTALALFVLGALCVGGIGWLDDHRPLPVWPRLAVHAGAAMLVSMIAFSRTGVIWHAVAGFALTMVLVNIWNFMDGINGLASSQALVVAAGWLPGLSGAWWYMAAALAAGCVGFLPFNFPRARIFLGDVGSSTLGYALATLCTLQLANATTTLLVLLPLAAFAIDAGLTLLRRMVKRQQWWTPHATHAYQRLARVYGHPPVTLAYGAFTAATVMVAMARWHGTRAGSAMAVLGVGTLLWLAVVRRFP